MHLLVYPYEYQLVIFYMEKELLFSFVKQNWKWHVKLYL